MLTGVLACPSWCELGAHDGPVHSRLLLDTEQAGMRITVWLNQTIERYSRFTPNGGHRGRTHVGAPTIGVMWERDEYDLRTLDLAPAEAEVFAPVLEAMFGPNEFADALTQAAALTDQTRGVRR